MSYLGTKPQTATQLANSVVTTESIADGAVTPSDLSTGHPNWDTSGNVGIGTSSPSATLHITNSNLTSALLVGSQSDSATWGGFFVNGATSSTGGAGMYGKAGANLYFNSATGYGHVWTINGAERMRIDSSGNLLVGSTTTQNNNRLYVQSNNFMVGINGTNSSGEMVRFYSNGSTAGTISYTATTVAYNTSSDYRLKENIAPMTGALAKVSALKPVTYTWKVNGSDGQGFIAHELQAVVPECVTGEKDAVDADGNPVYQGIDTSFLVATLTAAIQEQQVIITSLEARLTALESK